MADDKPNITDPNQPSPPPSFIGQKFDHYHVVETLGEGGMGIVFKALDTHLDRFVAVKTLRTGLAADDERKKRFTLEAKSASALNHPNIIHIYDIGTANSVDFIAMEYVQGKTLDQLIGPKGMAVRDALKYGIQAADALDAAHHAGIVHRDLKPGNIMVTERGLVKVLDFGLAKLSEQPAPPDPIHPEQTVSLRYNTIEGALVGTPAYMSPEQAEGATLDGRSDIFSFGLILYQMVTGKRAFEGGSAVSVLTQILRDEPLPPTSVSGQVPAELERVILRCLRKDPERRYQHMSEVRIALEDLRDESISGTTISGTAARGRVARKKFLRNMALPSAAFLAIAGGIAWWLEHRSKTSAAVPASEPMLTRLTIDPGLSTDPSISRDGKLLAYASDRSGQGNLDIWVRQIGGGQPIQLTTDPADDSEPDFSPDGTRIAFHSERGGGGVYVIPALGGSEERLADGGRRPRFSPDGSQIAYWAGVAEMKVRASFSRVYTMSSRGGSPRAIDPDFTARWPVWTPDGKSLLFLGTRTPNDLGSYAWWITALDGSAPRKTDLPVNPVAERREPLVWRNDQVVYPWHGNDASVGLQQLGFSPATGRVSGQPRRLTFGTAIESHPSCAADGRLVFASLTAAVNLYTLPVKSNEPLDEQPAPLSQDLSEKTYPAVSADGKELVYSKATSRVAEIWIHDMATGKERALTNSGRVKNAPAISADGKEVVYGEDAGNKTVILALSTSGGTPRQLCENCGSPSAWFPDGSKVLAADYSRQSSIDLVDVATGQKVEYLKHPQYSLLPRAVSPDGRWIAFTVDVGGGRTPIYIAAYRPGAPPAENEWIRITDGATTDGMPRWSPDGSLLYFNSERDGFLCLWAQRLNLATQRPIGAPFAIHHFHGASLRMDRTTAIGPNKIIFELREQTGNIWMLEPQSLK
ncbi:MAG TPA: protein kinase [Bryobacteraceae bacterium]|nr:protein kinase [Bryobacteraceae bacterium]